MAGPNPRSGRFRHRLHQPISGTAQYALAGAPRRIHLPRIRFGANFGIGTDVKTGPNGNLFEVSLSTGYVFEVYKP
jgi:hypothetical protein